MERRSRLRGRGVHRTEVTNGASEEEEELEEGGGGGRGIVAISWRERESITDTEEPEGNARRPAGLKSADPKLFRLGGPGSIQSHDSVGNGLGVVIPLQNSVSKLLQ